MEQGYTVAGAECPTMSAPRAKAWHSRLPTARCLRRCNPPSLDLEPVVLVRPPTQKQLEQALGRIGEEEQRSPAFVLGDMRSLVSA